MKEPAGVGKMTYLRVPVATYRLQFTSELGFDEARALIPYLEALGITDLYASPLFQAQEGSEHGYDVTDPRRLDTGVGGRSGFEELSADLSGRGMGLLLDIVPNHMAASPENPWWRDVLRWGHHSVHAAKFDIEWEGAQEPGAAAGKLVLPILGAPLAEVLENGELKLVLGNDGFQIYYHEHHLPVCPNSYQFILAECLLAETNSPGGRAVVESLIGLTAAIGDEKSTSAMTEAVHHWQRIWELYQIDAQVREFINRILAFWNSAASRKRFAHLVARQYYQPVYWRDTRNQLNYRRFFDINNLVSLRIEDEAVFRAVHARVLELARASAVTGLRIDHVDGLNDPEGYLNRLQERLAGHQLDNSSTQVAGQASGALHFYLLVEKILKAGEELPHTWPVAGTTGYDFLNEANGLFVDGQGLDLLTTFYRKINPIDFAALVNTQKRKIMFDLFSCEIGSLLEELMLLSTQDPEAQNISAVDLEAALVGVTAAFPVYRTYTRGFCVTPSDEKYIDEALATAARYGDGSEPARTFLSRLFRLEFNDDLPEEMRHSRLSFVMRWQQFTGPIMAKGFEDTVLYLYNRLLSLNEVGGDPSAGELSVAEFHKRMLARHASSPHTMNTTSTHDTKRSEDMRARINVLSEMPKVWLKRFGQWQAWNAPKKLLVAGRPVPDANSELFLYQTLIGAWPLDAAEEAEFVERLKEYLVKASREAKAYTNWLNPNEEYENALCSFALRILEDVTDNSFREDLKRLVGTVAYYGALNSLAQLVLKVVCSVVPEFFMGSELWDFSMVDPDNRRPVDFERRIKLLAELQDKEVGPALAQDLLQTWDEDRLKFFVTWKALSLRRGNAMLFTSGAYLPLDVAGPAQGHVCALARYAGNNWVVAAVPRLPLRLTVGAGTAEIPVAKPPVGEAVWADTALYLPPAAPARWQNVFTGEIISAALQKDSASAPNPSNNTSGTQLLAMAEVLGNFPVALLTPTE